MIGSGRRIRTCRDLINSQAHPPRAVDRNKLVDRLRVELSTSCLQGNSPPRRPAQRKRVHARLLGNGARTWFRATLSCSSGRRFHQISFPSDTSAFTRRLVQRTWCGLRESNSRHRSGTPRPCQSTKAAWWMSRESNSACTQAQVLQTRSVTRLGDTRLVAADRIERPASWV